jgi:hypothetical protein
VANNLNEASPTSAACETVDDLKIRALGLGCDSEAIAVATQKFGSNLNKMTDYLQRIILDKELADLKRSRKRKTNA